MERHGGQGETMDVLSWLSSDKTGVSGSSPEWPTKKAEGEERYDREKD